MSFFASLNDLCLATTMMHWVTSLILISGLVSASNLDHAKQKSLTQFFNFDDVCPSDEFKKEVCLFLFSKF